MSVVRQSEKAEDEQGRAHRGAERFLSEEAKEMNPCPNCGGIPVLRKHRNKVYYECNGDCWTRTHSYYAEEDAAEEWNSLKKSEHMEEGLGND